MKYKLQILSENDKYKTEIEKLISNSENKKPTTKILNWKFENNYLAFDSTNDLKILFYTLKWIDDLIWWGISDRSSRVKFIISKHDETYDLKYDDVYFIRFIGGNNSLEKEIEHLTFVEIVFRDENYTELKINFNRKLEYTNIIDFETTRGMFKFQVARTKDKEYLYSLLWKGELKDVLNLRIHYQCETSEVFGSHHCDCREQLNSFLDEMTIRENDLVIYAHEEGRGLGLFNKNNAYFKTQKEGLDTYDAMMEVAGKTENRNFEIPADIIVKLGIKEVNIWTNNPRKIIPLEYRGIKVNRMKAWYKCTSKRANKYMSDKRRRLGHIQDGK